MPADAFYEPLDAEGTAFRSTEHTSGPWDVGAQHGGPPSALLGRAVERCQARDDTVVARVTVEILGAVPVADVEVRARVVRPGRSVELVEAVLSSGGRDRARAAAWRVLCTGAQDVPPRQASPPPLPEAEQGEQAWAEGWVGGYLQSVQWRFAAGSFADPGPCTVWTRLGHPVVDGEEPTGLQRLLAVADSGNGLSSELDLRRWMFINPELSVHLHRYPAGEWVCVDAQTTISAGGAGLATSVLSDEGGPVAVGAQSLLVVPR